MHTRAYSDSDQLLRLRTTVSAVLYLGYRLVLLTLGDWQAKQSHLLDQLSDLHESSEEDRKTVKAILRSLRILALIAELLILLATVLSQKYSRLQ